MCGLPGERAVDLDGIIDMAERIAWIGKDVTGRHAEVTASVSNFIPKPHTAYQWNGLQSRDYLHWAHRYLKAKVKVRSVTVKCHDLGIDVAFYSHRERPIEEVLPWDHIRIKFGRDYLVKEQSRSLAQLEEMAGAV
jgi:radical SAM superfamily enzyme YgiQ (UPF0313 family)